MVQPGQPIPSVHDPTALVDPAAGAGTDIGNVGRNVLRGPHQSNLDFSVRKQFPLTESRALEFHADFFNLLNHPNRDNPVSDISTADFGKVLSFSSSPRIVQFALKFVLISAYIDRAAGKTSPVGSNSRRATNCGAGLLWQSGVGEYEDPLSTSGWRELVADSAVDLKHV